MTRREILERLRDGARLNAVEREALDVLIAVANANVLETPAGPSAYADLAHPFSRDIPPLREHDGSAGNPPSTKWVR